MLVLLREERLEQLVLALQQQFNLTIA